MKFKPIYYTLVNIIVVTASFLFLIILKPATKDIQLPLYIKPFIIFIFFWTIFSSIRNKFNPEKFSCFKKYFKSLILTDLLILLLVVLSLYIFELLNYSKFVVLGTILLSFIIESILSFIYYRFRKIPVAYEPKIISDNKEKKILENTSEFKNKILSEKIIRSEEEEKKYQNLKNILINEIGEDVFNFINKYIDITDKKNKFISTSTKFNIESLTKNKFHSIINLKKVNSIRRINKFLESVNSVLPDNGVFIGCVETNKERDKRIFEKFPPVINYIFYFFDFIFTRVFPKLTFFKSIYFFITKGKNRVISKAEMLGRIYSCGFEIIEEIEINNLLYFIVRKIRKPVYDLQPSYGPIFKMKRIGKGGEIIYVYKFRTMHPYSEYLQNYILSINGYSDIGKPANDFRLTKWGKFMRKYWLDELPQLINVIKGEMRLVGIRPLSKRFLDEYPDDVLKLRLKHKPGCIPPYVALLKQDVKEYIESERIYLNEKQKNPILTDYKYFFKAIYNIATNKIRSA